MADQEWRLSSTHQGGDMIHITATISPTEVLILLAIVWTNTDVALEL